MRVFYDLIFTLFSFLYFPYFVLKRKYHKEFIQRFGILPKGIFEKIKGHKVIWIHAVSVGEVNAALPLCKLLRQNFPQSKIVFSTITQTGNKLARKFVRPNEIAIYFPFDFSSIVNKVIELINPRLVIILETEIWPNFISQCKKNGIPIFLVNARISDNSFVRYKLAEVFLKPVLNKINLILTQTDKDARRIISLGADENKVKVTGNMKFDNTDYTDSKKDYADLRLKLGMGTKEKLLVAGSTHPGEEKIILSVYKELLPQTPDLRLLIAPRHIERVPELELLVNKKGFSFLKISYLNQAPSTKHQAPVFILDTIGQLKNFYAVADIVFVGGSLIKKGGHNIIEPAIFSKPIISGKHYFNSPDIFRVFIDNQAILICQGKGELKQGIIDLLENPEKARKLGIRGREVVLKQQGATQENLEFIRNYLH
jgi:3-deoxy-D-manno-octulosonic-acid transferase